MTSLASSLIHSQRPAASSAARAVRLAPSGSGATRACSFVPLPQSAGPGSAGAARATRGAWARHLPPSRTRRDGEARSARCLCRSAPRGSCRAWDNVHQDCSQRLGNRRREPLRDLRQRHWCATHRDRRECKSSTFRQNRGGVPELCIRGYGDVAPAGARRSNHPSCGARLLASSCSLQVLQELVKASGN